MEKDIIIIPIYFGEHFFNTSICFTGPSLEHMGATKVESKDGESADDGNRICEGENANSDGDRNIFRDKRLSSRSCVRTLVLTGGLLVGLLWLCSSVFGWVSS